MERPTVTPPKDTPDVDAPLVDNAADQKQVKQARTRVRASEKQLINDMATVLDTPAGRRLMKHYLGFCQVFHAGFTESPAEVQFREGMRNVGIKLLLHVEQARPDLISIMRQV